MAPKKLREIVGVDFASDASKPSTIDAPEEIRTGMDMGIENWNYPYLPIYVHHDTEPTFPVLNPIKQEAIILDNPDLNPPITVEDRNYFILKLIIKDQTVLQMDGKVSNIFPDTYL